MKDRIREIRRSEGLSRAAFGKRLGVSGDVINNLERGRVELKEHFLKLICMEYHVSERWLRTGKGEMHTGAGGSFHLIERYAEERGLSQKDILIIERILSLNPKVWGEVVDFLEGLAYDLRELEEEGEEPEETAKSETAYEREARLLREEADAVEQEGARSSASPMRGRKEA